MLGAQCLILQTIAAQKVHYLHVGSRVAHLDITSSNIMLRKEGYTAWDQLRLLDFGFAQCCSKGKFSCTHGWLLMTQMSESFLPHAMFFVRDCNKL